MAKKRTGLDDAQHGPDPEFTVARNKRLSIVVTPEQLEAVKEVAGKQKPRQTASSWGLSVVLDALAKEGYKKW